MKIDELFEHWGVDFEQLRNHIASTIGDVPSVVGGSLVDELGTKHSDIDLFCFCATPTDLVVDYVSSLLSICFTELRGLSINLHLVQERELTIHGEALKSLSTPGLTIRKVPMIPYEELFVLHALCRGVILLGDREVESIRDRAGADLFPLYLCLRSAAMYPAFAHDVIGLVASGEKWGALAASRHCLEVALDAWLSCRGYANPNPKWRVPLAQQAYSHGRLLLSFSELCRGLFPSALRPEVSIVRCLNLAERFISALVQDPLASTYLGPGEALNMCELAKHELRRSGYLDAVLSADLS
jgi:hypothetical protein